MSDNDVPATREGTGEVAARAFHQFIQMVEDGRLNGDLTDELRNLNAAMNDFAHAYGSKCKGSLTLKLDFTLDKGIFEITSDYKVQTPKAKRDRTIAWSTANNEFTPQNPRQMNLFGKPRDVTSGDAGQVRTA
jgi:hypothetical protein